MRYVAQCLPLVIAAVLLAPFAGGQNGAGGVSELQTRIIDIFEENREAVVRVKAIRILDEDEEGRVRTVVHFGTGFYVSRSGLVLTNASVAYGADRVVVIRDRLEYLAEVVGHDPHTNLSLLNVLSPPPDQAFLHLNDGDRLPPVGAIVLRISSPLEFEPTPDFGLVTGRESSFSDQIFPTTYVRTNLAGGPGEGGAPLLDMNGRVVGMMVASIADLKASYALPSRAVKRVRDDLILNGEVIHGWIGFELDERVTRGRGRDLLIREILPDTPASEVGLKADDILLKLGDFDTRTVDEVRTAMFYVRPNEFVTVKVQRGDSELEFTVRAGRRPKSERLYTEEPPVPAISQRTGEGTPEPDS